MRDVLQVGLPQVDSIVDTKQLVTVLLTSMITALVTFVYAKRRRRRLVCWTVLYDQPINQDPGKKGPDKGHDMWQIVSQKEGSEKRIVDNGSLVVLDIMSAGNDDIDEADFKDPISFTFPGRKVVDFKVRDSEYVRKQFLTNPPEMSESTIKLPSNLTLNKHDRFKLLILLDGEKADEKEKVRAGGKIKGGEISKRVRRTRRYWLTMWGTLCVAVLLAGLLIGGWVASESNDPIPECATGTLKLAGSTAFAPIVTDVANEYMRHCPGASIKISAVGSDIGVDDLRKTRQPNEIAMSDGMPVGDTTGLEAHPLGIVPFAIVANKDLKLVTLDTPGLRSIFNVHPKDSYLAVGRKRGSGTRRTFEQNLLGTDGSEFPDSVECPTSSTGGSGNTSEACTVETTIDLLTYVNRTPNAIGYAEVSALSNFPNVDVIRIDGFLPTRDAASNGTYRFVAAEYFYTAGPPRGLTATFINFLASDEMTKRLRDRAYVGCSDLSKTSLGGECQ